MKIAFYNAKQYDQKYFNRANQDDDHDINYISAPLNVATCSLITDEQVVCAFINDDLHAEVL